MKQLLLCLTLGFAVLSCSPEKAQKTVAEEEPTYTIPEVLKGYWAVTDLAIGGQSNEVEKERGYFYEFKDDGTFETGSKGGTMSGRFFVEADTIWLISDIVELEPEPMKVVQYNQDTLIVGGIHEKTQLPLEMTLVNLEREKLPKD